MSETADIGFIDTVLLLHVRMYVQRWHFLSIQKYLIQSLRRSITPNCATEIRKKIILLNLLTSRQVQTLGHAANVFPSLFRDIFHLLEVGDTPGRQKLRVCDIRHTLRLARRKNAEFFHSNFLPGSPPFAVFSV